MKTDADEIARLYKIIKDNTDRINSTWLFCESGIVGQIEYCKKRLYDEYKIVYGKED
jgi:hypothetical protein